MAGWFTSCAAAVLWASLTATATASSPPALAGAAVGARLLDVPYLPQTDDLCGGAAVAMVLRYWGQPQVYPDDFLPLVDRSASGIRTDVLTADVRRRGWQALLLTGDGAPRADVVRDHVNRGRPVIALVQVAPDRYHYVVIVAFTGDRVILHDPAQAPFRVLSRAEFEPAWAAAGGWALLVMPSAGAAGLAPPPVGGSDVAARRASHIELPLAPVSASTSPMSPCAALVAEMVARGRLGDTAAAEAGLATAVALCPDSPAAWRELAGARFLRQRWAAASEAAVHATRLDPADAQDWDLLATSRFLDGQTAAALDAWNHIGRPTVDLVRIQGARRTRQPVIAAMASLPSRALFTPERLGLAERRLAELPSAALTQVTFRPAAGGLAEVDVIVVEPQSLPRTLVPLVSTAARTAAQRELTVAAVTPTGSGETWTASWRWWQHRPRVGVALAMPSPAGLPGITTVDASWERQTYAVPDPTDSGRLLMSRQARRRGGVRVADWATTRVRWESGLALDTWGRRRHAAIDGALDLRLAQDHVSLRVDAAAWTPIGSGDRFATAGISTSWRSTLDASQPSWHASSGLAAASAAAPLDLWSGAGTGHGRAPLLRAHSLLDDGVVRGGVFGRRLLHGTVEYQLPLVARPGAALRLALFADTATAWRGVDAARARALEVDAGLGARVALPGRAGTARVDVARGLRHGGVVLSAGWQAPWPGR